MKRALANLILRFSNRWLEDTHSESQVRSFLRQELAHLGIPLDIAIPSAAEIRAWRTSLPEGKAIHKSVVRAGTARCLDALEAAGDPADRALIDDTLERLLRQVEVKRRRSLSQFDPPLSPLNTWMERSDTLIWFCRAARRREDLRLLNAALKLEDWLIHAYRQSWPERLRAHALQAVAETEETFAQMTAQPHKEA